MQIKELIQKYEEKYTLSIQEKWDNGGVQVGNTENEIKGILCTLEITPESIQFAKDNELNLIFSHHPIIFPYINNVDSSHFKGSKIIDAIKNDITIYASHTSSDQVDFNDYIFEKIGLTSEGKISMTEDVYGYGSYATKEVTLSEIVQDIKNGLDLESVLIYGNKEKFSKIGLATGSGMDFVEDAQNLGVDLFITGDITHHHAMDAMEKGMALIDITHEGSERLFMDFSKEILSKYYDGKIMTYKNDDKYIRKIL